ncbi:hypothetical protein ABKN59_006649 [Abortiporus biennis]
MLCLQIKILCSHLVTSKVYFSSASAKYCLGNTSTQTTLISFRLGGTFLKDDSLGKSFGCATETFIHLKILLYMSVCISSSLLFSLHLFKLFPRLKPPSIAVTMCHSETIRQYPGCAQHPPHERIEMAICLNKYCRRHPLHDEVCADPTTCEHTRIYTQEQDDRAYTPSSVLHGSPRVINEMPSMVHILQAT